MPPSTRPRPSAQPPPSRIYESITPLAQVKLPPIRQRVYGRHSFGAPLTKKRQGTLTQIGFVNPEKICDEIAEYEKEEMERNKWRKSEGRTSMGRGLRAKPVIGQRVKAIPLTETRSRQMMVEEGNAVPTQPLPAQLRQEVSVQRLDDTPEPEIGEGRPKKRRKSRRGITIGVKTVVVKVESPEVQRTQYYAQSLHHDMEQEETQQEDVNMVMDSFQAAPTFEEERDFESHVNMEAEQAEAAQRRRNRVIPDSDAESEDESIVYDSTDEVRSKTVPATPLESLAESVNIAVPRGSSDVDLDEVKMSVEEQTKSERHLTENRDLTEEDIPDLDLDLTREIPDSQAESEDDEDVDVDLYERAPPPRPPPPSSRPVLKQEDTLILNSFSLSSTGSPAVEPQLKTKVGPHTIQDSFSAPGSSEAAQQPIFIKDSFYHKADAIQQDSSFKRLAAPVPSSIPEEEVDFVPSSSAVSGPEAPELLEVEETAVSMLPPPVTPRKPPRTEIPNTGSTSSSLSTQRTMRSMTPNSVRSKRYTQSPSKAYNRSFSKKLNEKKVFNQSIPLPQLSQIPRGASSLQLRESQISTQGTPTQRSRVSRASSFVKPEPQFDIDDEEETTIIPQSSSPIKPERNDTQNTTDTNSPSKQIHSEISAALSSEQDHHEQPPMTGRTIQFLKTEIKDSQAESDGEEFGDREYHHSIEKPEPNSEDEIYDDVEYYNSMEEELHDRGQSMEIVVEGDRVHISSSKHATPRVVRFQSVAMDILPQPQFSSSPMENSIFTQASSMIKPSVILAETQMSSQWLGSDGLGSAAIDRDEAPTQGNMGVESQWLGDLLPESLMGLAGEELSVPPIMDDDSVWDEFRGSRSSIEEVED